MADRAARQTPRMPTDSEAARAEEQAKAAHWLEMFFRFFAAPSPESYAPLFHVDGSLQDAGMAEPLPAARTGAAIAMVLAKLPDLKIQPLRHAIRGNRVFVEARNTGTMGAKALEWGAVYRVHLKDGLVHRGRRFYDQAELFRPILPAGAALPPFPGGPPHAAAHGSVPDGPMPDAPMPDGPMSDGPMSDGPMSDGVEALLARLAAGWNDEPAALAALYAPGGRHLGAGLAAPLGRRELPAYGRWLGGLLSPAGMQVADWAADRAAAGNVLFVEWHGVGQFMNTEVPLDRIDRYLLDEAGYILDSRSYMDTLGIVETARPEVAAIRAAVIKS